MLLSNNKEKLIKLLKIAILALWAGILLFEFRPAQAEEIAGQFELALTTLNVLISDADQLQMYTLLPVHRIDSGAGEHVVPDSVSLTQRPSHYISDPSSSEYSSYRLGRSYPGIGLRYSVEQDWFVYGETRIANYRPLASEPQLFHRNEPRSIVLGGGIHF